MVLAKQKIKFGFAVILTIILFLVVIATIVYFIITTNYQLLLIHASFFGALVLIIFYSTSRSAPYVPTPEPIIKKMLTLAEIKPGEIVYDLGSGDGRILITAARDFGAKAVGIESNHSNVIASKQRVHAENLDYRVRIEESDFFQTSISDADVITLYLRQNTNDKLGEKFRRELRPGCRIVSYTFILTEWIPTKIDKENHIYLYTV